MPIEQKLLSEAIRIGEELVSKAQTDEFGLYWETIQSGTDRNSFAWKKSPDLYGGTAGILLFLVQLYRQTQSPPLLKTIEAGADWIYLHSINYPSPNYAFYTGRLGISYVLVEVAKVTGKDRYVSKALKLVDDVEAFIETAYCNDVLSGTAGTLLGLLHLHSHTRQKNLLGPIERFADHLIKKAHLTNHGIYWDKSEKNIRGLCGFSHGAGGISAVFMELGYYFENSAFYYIAQRGFAYENHFFDRSTGNWPDFRKGIFDKEGLIEHRTAYLNQDLTFFKVPNNMAAWCHGAPGIGLARARAVQLLGNSYQQDLSRALSHTYQNMNIPRKRPSYTLCHGFGGNAALFFEDGPKGLKTALKVGLQACEYKEKNGVYEPGLRVAHGTEDLSLFMGNAGIGYFYMMCCAPTDTPNILYPIINQQAQSKDLSTTFTKTYMQEKLIKSVFPETLSALSNNPKAPFSGFNLSSDKTELKKDFIQWLRNELTKDKKHLIPFGLEMAKNALEESIGSYALLHITRLTDKEESLKHLSDLKNNYDQYEAIQAPYTAIIHLANSDMGTLLFATTQEIKSFTLNSLSETLIRKCSSSITVETLIQQCIAHFDPANTEEYTQAKYLVEEQIKEMVSCGILVLRPKEFQPDKRKPINRVVS